MDYLSKLSPHKIGKGESKILYKLLGMLKTRGCGHLKGFNIVWKRSKVEDSRAGFEETKII